MPGATATHIRKADIAEDIGKLLLRQFCAIAPISKPDDFGIDAIATILNIDKNNKLRELADKTFGIQFKAKSVRKIEFLKEHEYKWLLNLEFPYFIGSVDTINSSMEVYTIHLVSCIPDLKNNCNGFTIYLKDKKYKGSDNSSNFVLGDPVITLSLEDINDYEKLKLKKEILSKWILCEYENIRTRNIAFTKALRWEKNKMPKFYGVNKLRSNIENINVYNYSFDFIDAVLSEIKIFSNDYLVDESVNVIKNYLNKKGIELWQLNNFDLMSLKRK